MNISRRWFIGGAASFGALGAFGGNGILDGRGFRAGGVPKLRFGVVSDIHISYVGEGEDPAKHGNNQIFRRTLEWFRDQKVDAVVIAGDMADHGLVEELEAVAEAWYRVFPDDRAPDGRMVEKVFVYGNHDWHGWTWAKRILKKYPEGAERDRHILAKDYGGWWEKIFHEPYAPVYLKTIKGYPFVGQHWDPALGEKNCQFSRLEEFLKGRKSAIDPNLPFFYVQHPHLKDTCYGPWAWGHDGGNVTQTLSSYPNAIAFSGHSHYSLTDERSVWQGAFTSVGAGSLRYTGMPYDEHPPAGYENTKAAGKDARRYDAAKMMDIFERRDCCQGMLWSVYEDCIVAKRREFVFGHDVGDDWVLPLPAAESKPFAFAERAKKFGAPKFVDGGKITVESIRAKNRGEKGRKKVEKDAFKVIAPAAVADVNARLYNLEFVVEAKDGVRKSKLVIPEGFNHSVRHKKARARSFCIFAKDELPGTEVRFTAIPRNCFGKAGSPVCSDWMKAEG